MLDLNNYIYQESLLDINKRLSSQHLGHLDNSFQRLTEYTDILKAPNCDTICFFSPQAVRDEDTMSSSSVGMSDLSDEILLCILRHVPLCDLVMNVSNVCIKLHTLCYDKTLLSKVSLSDEYQVNHFELMRKDRLSEDIYLSFLLIFKCKNVYTTLCVL